MLAQAQHRADPRVLLIGFAADNQDAGWHHVATSLPDGVAAFIPVTSDGANTTETIDALAARAEGFAQVACIGLGFGAYRALTHGRLLGARAILALAPGAGLDPPALDDLGALFDEPELAVRGQTVTVIAAGTSAEADARIADRLRASGASLQTTSVDLPAPLAHLALLQTGWIGAWLNAVAFATTPPPLATELLAAWREAFAHAITLDTEDAFVDSNGVLHLPGSLRNLSDRPQDLKAAAAAGLVIGVRRAGTHIGAGEPIARAGLAANLLDPQQSGAMRIRLEDAGLAQSGGSLCVALNYRGAVWLDAYGFPSVTLEVPPWRTAGDAAPNRPLSPAVRPPAPVRTAAARPHPPTASGGEPRTRPADVVAAYRTFLGREPESADTIKRAQHQAPTLWDLIHHVHGSAEAARRRLYESAALIAADQDARGVEVDATPTQLAELTRHTEAIWIRYGREQPYYSALAAPDFAADRIGASAVEAFYATGAAEVAAFEASCRRNGVDLAAAGTVLELGCRVGRLAEAFCAVLGRYVGVDISPEQLAIAESRFQARGLVQANVALLSQFLAATDGYDLFVSILALQHYPPPLQHAWLGYGFRHLRPGGLAYVQLPCFLYDYSFAVDPYVRGRTRKSHLEMHALPQHRLFALLEEHRLSLIEMTPSPRIGPAGVAYTVLARKAG